MPFNLDIMKGLDFDSSLSNIDKSSCKNKRYIFVYITTNLLNGKQYVGDHSSNNIENDIYLGSGSYFKNALNEYGRENFKREILEFLIQKKKHSKLKKNT